MIPPYLLKNDFLPFLKKCPGLIPVNIDAVHRKITWLDVDKYHFYEGFFYTALNNFFSLNAKEAVSIDTDIDVLDDDNIINNYIYPSGFIFHAGRCGSTLLSKVLARSRKNLVISEAEPLNQIWQVLTDNAEIPLEKTDRNKKLYKNLLLAMAKKRLESHENCFIKFSSYNIRF